MICFPKVRDWKSWKVSILHYAKKKREPSVENTDGT